jgi:predicted dienelactone hydrolase
MTPAGKTIDSARNDTPSARRASRDGPMLIALLMLTFLVNAAVTAPVSRGQTQPGVALTLPPPSVSTPIGTRSLHMVDRSRQDPFAAGRRHRELMVQLWYPAARARLSPPGVYMPAGTARVVESLTGVPSGAFGALRVHAMPSAPPARRRHPVVIFSPGLGVPRGLSTLLVEELAARGYVVVALDHTHDALAVQFPRGRVETGTLRQDRPMLRRALAVRVADVRFVLDRLRTLQRRGRFAGRLDLSRVGMVGHSLGGATAAATMLVDRRLRAGILLDGTVRGTVVERGLPRPFMIMNSAGAFERDANRRAFWANLQGPRFNFALAGAGHYAFTDLVALTPQFAPNIPPGLTAFMIGEIGAERAVPAVRAYVRAFFDRFLRGRPARLLEGPSPAYPQVRPLR